MKVRLIKRKSIEYFVLENAQARGAFKIWLALLKHADWNDPSDIIKTFGSADLLGNGSSRVVFNVGGNHYRIICKYHFGITRIHLYIKWIGTHAKYMELCNNNYQYDVDAYK